METVFSGIQPSGELHLGNYLGAVRSWVELQDRYRCFYCIVDYHAITQPYAPEEMQQRTRDMAIQLLACGVDPGRATLFVQSAVPQHTELAWVLSAVTPFGELGRMTQFKDKSEHHPDNINAGLFTYPVLQAADILLYGATRVPVGEDQRQHLELAREIVRRFNARFGDTFAEPQPLFSTTPKILGLDGQAKMSKSLGNTIALSEADDRIWDKLRTAATDPARVKRTDPGTPEKCNVYTLHRFFSDAERQEWVRVGCSTAGIGCIECKKALFENVKVDLARIRARGRPARRPGAGRRRVGGGRRRRAPGGVRDAGARARAIGAAALSRRAAARRLPLLVIVALVGALAAGACSGRDDGSSPEGAVRALIAAARAGDRLAVYQGFGPRTRARIGELLSSTRRTGATRILRPEDLVTVGWVPPAWDPAGTRLVSRDGDDAEVEVYSGAGDRQNVKVVREGRTWKVELPLR